MVRVMIENYTRQSKTQLNFTKSEDYFLEKSQTDSLR